MRKDTLIEMSYLKINQPKKKAIEERNKEKFIDIVLESKYNFTDIHI